MEIIEFYNVHSKEVQDRLTAGDKALERRAIALINSVKQTEAMLKKGALPDDKVKRLDVEKRGAKQLMSRVYERRKTIANELNIHQSIRRRSIYG